MLRCVTQVFWTMNFIWQIIKFLILISYCKYSTYSKERHTGNQIQSYFSMQWSLECFSDNLQYENYDANYEWLERITDWRVWTCYCPTFYAKSSYKILGYSDKKIIGMTMCQYFIHCKPFSPFILGLNTSFRAQF